VRATVTTEIDWIRQARQGDAAGWEHIVEEHQQPVFRLAYLLLGDADDAEDVTQETFIRAYRALDRFDPALSMRGWLLRIAANLTHNWRRSSGRYILALQRLLRVQPAPLSTPQLAEQRLEDQALWASLRELTPADQQVIYLRYFLEVSEAETAEILGVPSGTVKSRLHRALARLRAVLEMETPPRLLEEKND
jgi:RNA polymerase sigma-70 factor (ECF subfamily)